MLLCLSRNRTSLYHSLGTSIFEFIPAMLTFDHAQINRTLAALKVSISICNQHRKNYTFVESIGTIIKKVEKSILFTFRLSQTQNYCNHKLQARFYQIFVPKRLAFWRTFCVPPSLPTLVQASPITYVVVLSSPTSNLQNRLSLCLRLLVF